MPGSPRFAALVLTLGVALSACAGPGEVVGRRVVVGLYDAKSNLHLDLANQSHPDFADVYSREREDAALKLAPDDLMDQLVRDLTERLGFDSLSIPGAPPTSATGLRGWVALDRDGQRRTFVVPAAASAEQLQVFVAMKLLINEYYTHLGGLQFLNNPQGPDIFRGAQP